jgi:hypothetical protein
VEIRRGAGRGNKLGVRVEVAVNFSVDHVEVTALFIPFGYDGDSTLAPTP